MAHTREAVIQEDTTIVGKIRNCRQIEIHGYVEGDIVAEDVIVHQRGRLHGKVRTGSADVHGTLQGEVQVKDLITIRSSGSVNGNVQYGQLAMEMGGDLSAELRNAPPRLAGDLSITVRRGRSAPITTEDLNAIDPDDEAKNLTCTVSNATNGFVALADAKNTPVKTFTQADIEAGRVLFVHDGSDTSEASFDVVVSDAQGAVSGAPQTLKVKVLPDR